METELLQVTSGNSKVLINIIITHFRHEVKILKDFILLCYYLMLLFNIRGNLFI